MHIFSATHLNVQYNCILSIVLQFNLYFFRYLFGRAKQLLSFVVAIQIFGIILHSVPTLFCDETWVQHKKCGQLYHQISWMRGCMCVGNILHQKNFFFCRLITIDTQTFCASLFQCYIL